MRRDAVVDEMLTETLTDAQGADWAGDGEDGAFRGSARRTLKLHCGAGPANETLDEPRDRFPLMMLRTGFLLLGGTAESV